MARWGRDEIVVECANIHKKPRRDHGEIEDYGPTNTYQYCRTLNARLRGRWSIVGMRGMTSSGDTQFSTMPETPGIHVAVDFKRRRIRAVDPIGFPENAGILRRVNDIMRPYFGQQVAHDDMVIENATDWELKSALWEMANWVWDGAAAVVHGQIPDQKDAQQILALPGELAIRRNFFRKMPDADGRMTMESPFATEEELEKMGKPPEERVKRVPAGQSGG